MFVSAELQTRVSSEDVKELESWAKELVFFFYLETYTNKSGYPVYQKGLCRH
jgi:hypothetical protein